MFLYQLDHNNPHTLIKKISNFKLNTLNIYFNYNLILLFFNIIYFLSKIFLNCKYQYIFKIQYIQNLLFSKILFNVSIKTKFPYQNCEVTSTLLQLYEQGKGHINYQLCCDENFSGSIKKLGHLSTYGNLEQGQGRKKIKYQLKYLLWHEGHFSGSIIKHTRK